MDRKALWLTLHLGWALAWGVLLSIVPLQLLLLAAIALIPLFMLGEWLFLRKHGVKPALLSSLGLLSAVIFGAAMVPKSMDRPIGNAEPLPRPVVTLEELQDLDSRFHVPDGQEKRLVRMPSIRPTMREAVAAIEAQTPFRCRASYCFFGESILSGGYVRMVRFVPSAPPSAAAP